MSAAIGFYAGVLTKFTPLIFESGREAADTDVVGTMWSERNYPEG